MSLEFPFILPPDAPFKIVKGSYFTKTLRWTAANNPVDITDYTFEGNIREKYDSPSVLINLTSLNNGFTIIDADDGKFSMNLTPTQTGLFVIPLKTKLQTEIPFKDYVFDIDAIPPVGASRRFTFLKGVIRAYAEV